MPPERELYVSSYSRFCCFVLGFESFLEGLKSSLTCAPFLTIFYDNLSYLAILVASLCALIPVLVSPYWVAKRLFCALFCDFEVGSFWETCWTIFYWILIATPPVFSFLVRNVIGSVSDSLFFSVLKVQAPRVAEEASGVVVPWKSLLLNDLVWFLKFVGVLILSIGGLGLKYGLSLLGIFSIFRTAFQMYYCYQTIGREGLILSLLIFYFSPTSLGYLVTTIIGSIVLSKNFLYPFRSRIPIGKGSMKNHDLWEDGDMRWRYLLLGFGLPAMMIVSLPLVGWLFWFIVQGASSKLLLNSFIHIGKENPKLFSEENKDQKSL